MALAYAMRSRCELHHDAVEGGPKLSNTSSRRFSKESKLAFGLFFFWLNLDFEASTYLYGARYANFL